MKRLFPVSAWLSITAVFLFAANTHGAEDEPATTQPLVAFQETPGKLAITIGGKPFAAYVVEDPEVWRPYFANVHAPGGLQVTRNRPLKDGDPDDHAAMHPGIWMSFGDINGNDYWRLKAKTIHDGFIEAPKGGPGVGTFAVQNLYLNKDESGFACTEICRYTVRCVSDAVYSLEMKSTFSADMGEIRFGDQEEFGLGVRVAAPLMVGNGGQIVDSEGRKNEKGVWGKQAEWCSYRGPLGGKIAGITVVPGPDNFRPSWYHARDYGLLVANPFGRNAMTGGDKSSVVVKPGEKLTLEFTLLIFALPPDEKEAEALHKKATEAIKTQPPK